MHQSSLRSRSGRFLVLLTGCLIAITPAKAQSSSLQDRLDHLIQRLDERRVELHIPGMAIAVMLDGEMVLAHGFGLADVESGRAVTPETIFAIGSSTKAFTSTLVGMMIDDGKMQWDDPMTSFVPLFDLQVDSDDPDAVVTVRDALSHRSGFARMGVLWAAGTSSADMIFKTASKAEPVAPFRKKFYYNNVMYLAAGTAAARTGDTDWDTMVRERLLEPLGMNDSNTSVTEAMSDPRLSLGYIWNETRENFKRLPMRHLDAIGPAGSINSNVLDMAHWVQFQLDRGVYQGNRLISEERHQDTWTTQIDLAPSIGYGLGWFLQEWEGQPVVEHGGNIDGFGAQVALLPESNLGYVLLTNVTATPLQQGSMKIVWETMLGDLPDETQLVEAGDYQEFLGEYVANFASFKDDRFNVLVQNDKLAVDVPGQMIYELYPPDEQG
ncbi:MAG: serine hydrolase, partial [Planctomycetota bacterium]|nr:serine hydrolase [Planctomycetota bacterium]